MENWISSKVLKFKASDKKSQRVLINVILSFFQKGLGILVTLLLLPAYLHFFQNKFILGLWFTLLSVLSWILNFDFGIGNGLRNHLVEPIIKNDKRLIKIYISSSYILVGGLVIIILLLAFLIFPYLNWNAVFNISKTQISHAEMVRIVLIAFIGIMVQFFLRLINSILYAMQHAAIPGFLSLASNILILIYVLVAPNKDTNTNLKNLALFFVIAANMPLLVTTIVVFLKSKKLKYCFPKLKYFIKQKAFEIVKLGGVFMWLQFMYMFIMNTNEFLISWFIDTSKVVEYKIYNSIFGLIGIVFTLTLTPIWSAVTEAFKTNDYKWIRKIYKKLTYLALLAIVGYFLLIIFSQPLINIWLKGKAIKVNYIWASFFGISGMLFVWQSILSTIIAGLNQLKTAFTFMTLGAVINIPLAYLFTHFYHSWIAIVLANIISFLPYCIIQTIMLKKYLNKIDSTN